MPTPVPVLVPQQLLATATPAPSTPTILGSGGIKVTTSNPIELSNPINIVTPNANGNLNKAIGGFLPIPIPFPKLPLPFIGRLFRRRA